MVYLEFYLPYGNICLFFCISNKLSSIYVFIIFGVAQVSDKIRYHQTLNYFLLIPPLLLLSSIDGPTTLHSCPSPDNTSNITASSSYYITAIDNTSHYITSATNINYTYCIIADNCICCITNLYLSNIATSFFFEKFQNPASGKTA